MTRQRQLSRMPDGRRAGLYQMRLRPASDAAGGTSYLFIAPLDDSGQIDIGRWRELRGACRVFQMRADGPVRMGSLFHRNGTSWTFQYDGPTVSADDSVLQLEDAALEPGRKAWVTDRGVEAEYRVTSVERVWN